MEKNVSKMSEMMPRFASMCLSSCMRVCLIDGAYCDTAQGKDAPRGNFLMLHAEYLGRYTTI